jgi:hypothetical protein
MGKIYSQAQGVMIWQGEEDEDGDLGMDILKTIGRWHKQSKGGLSARDPLRATACSTGECSQIQTITGCKYKRLPAWTSHCRIRPEALSHSEQGNHSE